MNYWMRIHWWRPLIEVSKGERWNYTYHQVSTDLLWMLPTETKMGLIIEWKPVEFTVHDSVRQIVYLSYWRSRVIMVHDCKQQIMFVAITASNMYAVHDQERSCSGLLLRWTIVYVVHSCVWQAVYWAIAALLNACGTQSQQRAIVYWAIAAV